ncbi:hypothetical protein [Streptomyces shenzhenensis]|uniref:hypothetical protein n=1 Tax=Streptomyces shenzhenensis TaxID=943815 RepID=UPI0015F03181|nr:hypothetical protein [Streptomyces shenzhenensis]
MIAEIIAVDDVQLTHSLARNPSLTYAFRMGLAEHPDPGVWRISAVSASEIQHWPSSSQTARGCSIGVQTSSSMRAMVTLTEEFIRMVMEKRPPRARQALSIFSAATDRVTVAG